MPEKESTLEAELANSRAALVIVSHDRAFLERVTNRCFWLEHRRVRREEAQRDRLRDGLPDGVAMTTLPLRPTEVVREDLDELADLLAGAAA